MIDWAWSPAVRATLRPDSTFTDLSKRPTCGRWLAVRSPLLAAFLLGSSISLAASGLLLPVQAVSIFLCWTFVPLADLAGLAVGYRAKRATLPWGRAVDIFCASYGPWLLWLIVSAAWWSLTDPVKPFRIAVTWLASGISIVIWSCCIDYRFYRRVFECNPAQAARNLALHRLISWGIIYTVFAGMEIWSLVGR